jgi:hypothetical protein
MLYRSLRNFYREGPANECFGRENEPIRNKHLANVLLEKLGRHVFLRAPESCWRSVKKKDKKRKKKTTFCL